MSNDHKRQQKDAVTIGQIRSRYLDTLERQIGELSGLIRKGYHSRHEAEKFLSEDIGRTLTTRLRQFTVFAPFSPPAVPCQYGC